MMGVFTAHDTQAAGANRRLPVIVIPYKPTGIKAMFP